jgi:hypothetical protein
VYVRVNAIIITKMLTFLLCNCWTTYTALGVIFINSATTILSSLVTLYRVANEFN